MIFMVFIFSVYKQWFMWLLLIDMVRVNGNHFKAIVPTLFDFYSGLDLTALRYPKQTCNFARTWSLL